MEKENDLREYFSGKLASKIEKQKNEIKKDRYAMRKLTTVDFDMATYKVYISTNWNDEVSWPCKGEENVSYTHKGNLQEAAEIAIKKFLEINKRSDVQGVMTISLDIGDYYMTIPKEILESSIDLKKIEELSGGPEIGPIDWSKYFKNLKGEK